MDTKQLKQKILDLAIRGKLVPQDPNEEPASVLLERIRAEKEQLIAQGKLKKSKSKISDKLHYENVPFEIPKNWEWCRLGDVCQIFGRIGFRGYTKNDLVESNGAITLSPSNISNGKMDYSKCTYISWYKYEESPEIQIFDGDIILVKTGSSYGKCALVENLPKKATINPQFVTLKHIHIEPKLLTYILQSSYARMNYDNFVLGTAIPTFTQVALSDMLIPIMSINEQQRIISAIERWFAVIDELEANKEELKKYIQQIKAKVLDLAIHGKLVPQNPNDEPAIELLKRINPNFKPCDTSHYENLPSGWCICLLEDIIDYEQPTQYIVESTDYDDEYKTPVLTAGKSFILGHTNESNGIYNNLPTIIFDDFTTDSRLVNFPFKVKSSAMKILQVDKDISIQYVAYFMSITRLAGNTHKRYWISEYSKIPIPIPPKEEQDRIVQIISEIENKLDSISAEL